MKNKGYYIIWPVYFDSTRTRNEGRRVNKNVAVKNPKITDLVQAAESMGYEIKINPKVLYPRFWHLGNNGNLLIKIEGSKTDVIKKIAGKLKKLEKKKK